MLEQGLQRTILTAASEASACLQFINRIALILNTIKGAIGPHLHPVNCATLSTVLYSSSNYKELCLATNNVLMVPIIRRKLGAFHATCVDQLVKILFYESQGRNGRRRRLDAIHGSHAVKSGRRHLAYS